MARGDRLRSNSGLLFVEIRYRDYALKYTPMLDAGGRVKDSVPAVELMTIGYKDVLGREFIPNPHPYVIIHALNFD